MVRWRASFYGRSAGARLALPRCKFRRQRQCQRADWLRDIILSGLQAISDSSYRTAASRQNPVDPPAPTGSISYRVRVFKKYTAFKNSFPITNDRLSAVPPGADAMWSSSSVPETVASSESRQSRLATGHYVFLLSRRRL